MLAIILITAVLIAAVVLRPRPQVALRNMSTSQRIDAILTMSDEEYAAATGR